MIGGASAATASPLVPWDDYGDDQGGGDGGALHDGPRAVPPSIRRATKMSRKIRRAYGGPDGKISCRYCSKDIALGDAMRRIRRTGKCWHDACYAEAGRGGLIPPKVDEITTMTKRIRKLHGTGDDCSVRCQMCGKQIDIGMPMRRPKRSSACWHDGCYRLTWGMQTRSAGRPPYIVSNSKWLRMKKECMKCAGSKLCDHHRHIERTYRIPRAEALAAPRPAMFGRLAGGKPAAGAASANSGAAVPGDNGAGAAAATSPPAPPAMRANARMVAVAVGAGAGAGRTRTRRLRRHLHPADKPNNDAGAGSR